MIQQPSHSHIPGNVVSTRHSSNRRVLGSEHALFRSGGERHQRFPAATTSTVWQQQQRQQGQGPGTAAVPRTARPEPSEAAELQQRRDGTTAADARDSQGAEIDEPCPILCTHCSKLPGERGLPVRRGLYLPWCKHCGISACCDLNGPNGQPRCKNDDTHQVVMSHTCEDCDANTAKNQVVLCRNAVPYSFNLGCERSGPGCTDHLFEASCSHVFCSACLMRALPQMLAPRKIASGDPTDAVKHLSDRFVTDSEDFIVPPCPICYALGVQSGDDGVGCFELQTCRMLMPDTFLNLKSVANTAFHRRQASR